jgi:hypothetical protein
LLLSVNSDGNDKQVLIVVGKSLKPHCFKNKQKTSCENSANKKVWMPMLLFIFCGLHKLCLSTMCNYIKRTVAESVVFTTSIISDFLVLTQGIPKYSQNHCF